MRRASSQSFGFLNLPEGLNLVLLLKPQSIPVSGRQIIMSSVPVEFDPVHVAANAAADLPMYRDELASKDPMHSVLDANPEIYFVPPKRSSEWGQWEFKPGSYYDTTVGSKHPFWRN